MKKLIAVISLSVALMLLCSCGLQTVPLEIKHRLIIQAIGFDKGENATIKMCVQALNTDVSTNASSNSVPDKLVRVYTVEGETVSQCVDALTLLTGKNPLLSQNRVIVLSSALARDGIGFLIDSFIRNNENRFTVYTAVSDSDAQDVISADAGDSVVGARLIEQIIEESDLSVPKTRLCEIGNCILDGNKCAVLPVLSVIGSDEAQSVQCVGTAVFKGERLSFFTDAQTAVGIGFISRNAVGQPLTFTCGGSRTVSAQILKSKPDISLTVNQGVPNFNISVSASLIVTEINSDIADRKSASDIQAVKLAAQDKIKSYIQTALRECIMENEADAFGFCRRIWRCRPDFYRDNEGRLAKILRESGYEITVNAQIVRTGDSVITV